MHSTIIVDDEWQNLALMRLLLERSSHYRIVGAYSNALEALDNIEAIQPNIVFLDIEMPRMNGIELARYIQERSKRTEIVFVTAYNKYIVEASEVSVLDVILKPVSLNAIARVTKLLEARSG